MHTIRHARATVITAPQTKTTGGTCHVPLMKPSMKSARGLGKSCSLLPPLGLVFAVALSFLPQGATAQTVNLGTAGGFGVLGGSGISNTGPTTITGNVGLSPTTGAAITGFPPGIVNGTIYAVDAFGPAGTVNNPGLLTTAKNNLATAYNDAAGRVPNVVYAVPTDLGGLTLVPGVYKGLSSFGITGALTLNAGGNQNAVWIFQAGSTLTTAAASSVVLINGADACNVFWQIGSSATLGTASLFKGTILAATSITLTTGAAVEGRLLADADNDGLGAVTLDTNTITVPTCAGALVVVVVDTTSGTIQAVQNTFANALSLIALTPNQTGVVGALDGALNDNRQRNVLAYLDGLDIRAVPHQLDRIAPEELTSIYHLGFAQFDTEVFSVQQRLAELRTGTTGAREGSRFPPREDKNVVPQGKGVVPWDKGVVPLDKNVAPMQMDTEDQWGFFITESGDFVSLGDTSNANGFDLKSAGTTLGVDRRLSDHFVLGLTLGYARTEGDLIDGGKLKFDGGKAALYGMYHHGGFYTEGLIGGGYNSYDTRRGALGGTANGSTDGGQFDASAAVGYDVKLGRVTVTPMASLLYSLVGINGFDERGSLEPLHIESQQESSLRTRVGLRAACTTKVGAANVTPSFSAEWQHEFLETALAIESRFANGAGSPFTVHGPETGRDSALLTAAVNVAWSRYACYLAYQANVGRENNETQTALAGFRASW